MSAWYLCSQTMVHCPDPHPRMNKTESHLKIYFRCYFLRLWHIQALTVHHCFTPLLERTSLPTTRWLPSTLSASDLAFNIRSTSRHVLDMARRNQRADCWLQSLRGYKLSEYSIRSAGISVMALKSAATDCMTLPVSCFANDGIRIRPMRTLNVGQSSSKR